MWEIKEQIKLYFCLINIKNITSNTYTNTNKKLKNIQRLNIWYDLLAQKLICTFKFSSRCPFFRTNLIENFRWNFNCFFTIEYKWLDLAFAASFPKTTPSSCEIERQYQNLEAIKLKRIQKQHMPVGCVRMIKTKASLVYDEFSMLLHNCSSCITSMVQNHSKVPMTKREQSFRVWILMYMKIRANRGNCSSPEHILHAILIKHVLNIISLM
jgi:hypothetical protein